MIAFLRSLILAGMFSLITQTARAEYIPKMPRDLSQVDFYLLTAGLGEEVYMAFGHTLLRVIDREAGTDVLFNWGVFSFDEPNFIGKFVYGQTDYRMAAQSMAMTIRIYQIEERSLREDKINLTLLQKKNLMEKIIWNAQPDNLYYRYHYYFDNCSTKVRDYLDEAISGAVSKAYFERPGTESLRESIREHFDDFPLIGLATEILMNGDLEYQMTAWQEMYLPQKLLDYLSDLPQISDNGEPIAGTRLLSDTRIYLSYNPPKAYPFTGFQLASVIWVGLGLIAAPLMVTKNWSKFGIRFFGVCLFSWALFSAFFGLAMTVIWAFFVHPHGKHSANLWIFWPVDFYWCWLAFQLLKRGDVLVLGKKSYFFALSFLSAHSLAIIVAAGLYLSGLIFQDISNVLRYLAPISLFYAALTTWLIKREQ